jgi:arabinogalactan endo-1,4-beta-galactosidase
MTVCRNAWMMFLSLVATTPLAAGEYILGADVSSKAEHEDRGYVYVDTDGESRGLLALLKNHGFNFIRPRTFVEPLDDFGYASDDSSPGKVEAYNDRDHDLSIVEYGDARQPVNDIMRERPGGRGIGTFIWEPTLTGPPRESIFERQGKVLTARAEAFAEFDRISGRNFAAGPHFFRVGNGLRQARQ